MSIRRPFSRVLFALLLAVGFAGPLQAQRAKTAPARGADPALEQATAMFKARASASDVAAEMKRTHRADNARTVAILKTVGYGGDAIARAATETLRADATTTASLMTKAGMDASAVAAGLNAGARVSGLRALEALDAAGVRGVDGSDVLRATRASAADIATFYRAKGKDVATTARAIQGTQRLSSEALAAPLLKAYEAVAVARWMKEELAYSGADITRTLVNGGVPNGSVGGVLTQIGLAPGAPDNLTWWIRDYAMNSGPNDIIENAEIVNRGAVLQGASGADGTVWIEGDNLNHPEVEVWAGTTGGSPVQAEVRSRQTVAGKDRLEVYFPSMPSPGFRVTTPGGEAEVGAQAWPVGYAAIEKDLFETALEGLSISLDHDDGVEILFGGMTITGDLAEDRENGIETRITNLNSSGFEITTESETGGAALVLTISFEQQGREFEGDFFGYIPCWKCGSFEIPRAECAPFTINCVLDFLGQGIASLGACANPASWSEDELLDTQGVPFEGDLTGTTLAVRMAMHVDGAGLTSSGTTYDFQTTVALATGGSDVSLSVVDPYVRTRVNDRLTSAMEEIDLAQTLVDALNQYAGLLGWDHYLSMEPMPDGRLFVSFPG